MAGWRGISAQAQINCFTTIILLRLPSRCYIDPTITILSRGSFYHSRFLSTISFQQDRQIGSFLPRIRIYNSTSLFVHSGFHGLPQRSWGAALLALSFSINVFTVSVSFLIFSCEIKAKPIISKSNKKGL